MSSGHHPRSDLRSRRPVICHPVTRSNLEKKTSVLRCSGSCRRWWAGIGKGGGLRPWGGMEPCPGQECKARSEQGFRAPVEEGRSGQEEKLLRDCPLPQQGPLCPPLVRAWRCTPCQHSRESPAGCHPWGSQCVGQRLGRKDPEKGGSSCPGPSMGPQHSRVAGRSRC